MFETFFNMFVCIQRLVEHLSQTQVAQQRVTRFIFLTIMNLATPKVRAKNDLLFNKPILESNPQFLGHGSILLQLCYRRWSDVISNFTLDQKLKINLKFEAKFVTGSCLTREKLG